MVYLLYHLSIICGTFLTNYTYYQNRYKSIVCEEDPYFKELVRYIHFNPLPAKLTRIFHELLWRDREDGRATRQPQGLGPEAYLNSTSQGVSTEDAWKDAHIRGRSRLFMKYAG